jgi:hypothetical protein
VVKLGILDNMATDQTEFFLVCAPASQETGFPLKMDTFFQSCGSQFPSRALALILSVPYLEHICQLSDQDMRQSQSSSTETVKIKIPVFIGMYRQ